MSEQPQAPSPTEPTEPTEPTGASEPLDPAEPPLLYLRSLLSEEPTAARHIMERLLTEDAPQLRAELPRKLDTPWRTFYSIYRHLLRDIDASGGDRARIEETLAWCRDLGYDLAKYEVSTTQFSDFGELLDTMFRELDHARCPERMRWSPELAMIHSQFYEMITRAMAQGQADAVEDAGPSGVRIGATVVDVMRPTRDLAVVRLLTDTPIDYHPGQYLSVLTPYAHAEWRHYSPSLPTNPARQMEFHIRAVPGGTVSPSIVALATPGDRWVLSSPLGELEIRHDPGNKQDVLIIAGGTGIAPVRAMLFDLARFADLPRVHLFYGARFPGELYDLGNLIELASHSPWLTVQPVAEERSDPWWLDTSAAPELPQALHRFTYGRLDKVVTAYGGWGDRQILLAGPAGMLRATKEALIAKGAPPENISHDPLPGS